MEVVRGGKACTDMAGDDVGHLKERSIAEAGAIHVGLCVTDRHAERATCQCLDLDGIMIVAGPGGWTTLMLLTCSGDHDSRLRRFMRINF
ncbi:hypothetical protein [Mycetohabitans rhizoxinica]|uniref:hypothetical protein n=1 Tax=Mycetohabitans rhizoxinica TaxID=412963 RepID=UPI0030CD4DF2